MSLRAKLPVICGRAVIVALFVGTLLNLINQGDALFGGGQINMLKIVLTYLAPFAVSAHGGLAAHR